MNELSRTTFAQNELDRSTDEKTVRSTSWASSNKSPEVAEWPEDETGVHGDFTGLRPGSSPFGPHPNLGRLTKADDVPQHSSAPASLPAAPPKPARIAIKTKGKILLIDPADVLSVEAEGNYVVLHRHSDSYSLREAISSLAEKLREYGFVRIHRSVLVNSASVEEISPKPTGEYILRVAGGREYVVSRTYKPNLKWLAQSWIGTDSFVDD